MAKSFKFSNEMYLDCSGIAYNGTKLNQYISGRPCIVDSINGLGTKLTITESKTIKSKTITTNEARLLVHFCCRAAININNCWIDLYIDGVHKQRVGVNVNTYLPVTIFYIGKITKGTHTVNIYVNMNNSTQVNIAEWGYQNLVVAEI